MNVLKSEYPSVSITSNGGCRREEKSRKHWSLFTKFLSLVTALFYLLDQIKSHCMYWLHWKSQKNRTEPNELDELKYWNNSTRQPALLTALLSCFLVFLLSLIYSSYQRSEKKSELNELNELESLKTPSQMSGSAHWYAFLSWLV